MCRCAVVLAALALACGGCAEVPAGYASPPAARLPIPWQQFCEQATNVPQASALVAARGADGWELVAMYNGVLCYKRPAGDPVVQRPPQQPPQATMPPSPYVPILRDPGF